MRFKKPGRFWPWFWLSWHFFGISTGWNALNSDDNNKKKTAIGIFLFKFHQLLSII
jgi:hypothetical protein